MANKLGSPAREQHHYEIGTAPAGSEIIIGDLWTDTDDGKIYTCTSLGPVTWTEVTGAGAPTDADYLVGTANGDLSAEIVVGTTPGGELGNTWADPTVDATHSGSAHHPEAHNLADHAARAHSDLSDAPATAHHDNANDHANTLDHTRSHDLEGGSDHSTSSGVDGHILKQTGASTFVFEVENYVINFIIDGGGSAITTGVKGYIEIQTPGEIEQVTMLADQSGSIVVDIWKDSYANYPPLDADSITSSAVPTISGAIKSQDGTLTDWTKTLAAGDILGYNVDSITTVERLTISLKVRKT